MSMEPTVFVVDDDPAVRDSIALLLSSEGIAAEVYGSAETFLEAYDTDRPGCLVADVRMSGMGGLELQQILAEKRIRIPMIFITGHGDVPMAGRAFRAGAFDFIEKPFDNDFLLNRVRAANESDRQQRRINPESVAAVAPAVDGQLVEEKKWAEVTLHAIGEAVITTDASGVVEYLNPMAERLTGWADAEAHGQPVEKVFNVVDEQSRKPAGHLISRCLGPGPEVAVEQHNLLISRQGKELAVEETITPIRTGQGALLGVAIVFKDVTSQRNLTRELLHSAEHDDLTGLVNRREFEKRLGHAIAASKSHGAHHALCYLDLDQFKAVNDSAGHSAGDELLRQIATLMLAQVRDRDTLARLGGDEFALLLPNCPMEKALEIAESLVAEVGGYRFVWEGRPFQIGVSIGVVAITGVADSVAELLTQADGACYNAKKLGRNRAHPCMREAGIKGRQQSEWIRASSLASALEQGRFLLYNQPVVPLLGGNEGPLQQELLVRLLGNEGEVVLPRIFIPTAERNGLMAAIDRWVIRTAFHRHHEIFAATPVHEIAINLSAKSIADASLSGFVRQQIVESGIAAERICFEIGETTVIQQFNQAKEFILAMKGEGCRISLDDFGAGLSSFAYLKKLPVDYLKIDGGFVQGMLQNPVDHALVESINKIGHTMAVRTIGKWAESDAIVERLTELGIDYAQVYAIRSPCSLGKSCA